MLVVDVVLAVVVVVEVDEEDEVVVVIGPIHSMQYSSPGTTPAEHPAPTEGFQAMNSASVIPQNSAMEAQVSPASAGTEKPHALLVMEREAPVEARRSTPTRLVTIIVIGEVQLLERPEND